MGREKYEYAERVKNIACPVFMINSISDTADGGCCMFHKGNIIKELCCGIPGILDIEI